MERAADRGRHPQVQGSRPTTKEPERFANCAALLLHEKVEERQICSSKTEEKWLLTLRHLFGLKDDEGAIDIGIKGIGEIFVDKLERSDVEAWRDSWEPRINAGEYSPTTVNDWIAVLRVITKKMKADYTLAVDPCVDGRGRMRGGEVASRSLVAIVEGALPIRSTGRTTVALRRRVAVRGVRRPVRRPWRAYS